MRRIRRLWRETVGPKWDTVLVDLSRRYSEPGRSYHTFTHVAECLDHFDRYVSSSGGPTGRPTTDETVALKLAIWYHDAVYLPMRSDNEVRSAELARQDCRRMGMKSSTVNAVVALILATRHFLDDEEEGARAAATMRDLDLAVLGSDPARFACYERGIRREYGYLSDARYRDGRRRVLSSFLDRPAIYRTPWFASTRELPARANIAAQLAALYRPVTSA